MHQAAATTTTKCLLAPALGDALAGLAIGAVALAVRPFGWDAVLILGRTWLPEGDRLGFMRHADRSVTVAMGRYELTTGPR